MPAHSLAKEITGKGEKIMAWPKGKNHPRLGKHHSEETKRKIRQAKKGQIPWNKGKTGIYSKETLIKISEAQKGKKNHRWKGGIHIASNGYILILKRDHPFCDQQGYVSEHRLIAEKELGRYLSPKETLHHRNGKRSENNWDNLFVFESNSEHIKYERFLRRANA